MDAIGWMQYSSPMPSSYPQPQKITARFEDKVVLNEKFVQLKFELQEPHSMPFLAGQYVSIKVSEKGERRSYSISSSPGITHGFELLVDLSPNGVGSHYLKNLQFGQTIDAMGPMGRFVLEPEALEQEPTIALVATGSGLAPLYSMLQDLLHVRQDKRPIILYWGMRYDHELFWLDDLYEMDKLYENFSFHPVISRPGEAWTLCTGRITDCLTNHGILNPAGYYICGNKPMLEDVTNLLQQASVPTERVHFEKFY